MIFIIPDLYVTIPSYSLLATLGLCVSVLFLFFRIDKIGLSFKGFLVYIFGALLALLICSRIVFVIGMLPTLEKITFSKILYYLCNGGIVFYGGMLGSLLGVIFVAKIRKDNVKDMLNFYAPAIPLFHAFARMGCLFGGCCYGIPYNVGVIMVATPNIVRFPVQLVESVCNILIFIIIYVYEKKNKSGENQLKIYMCTYAVCRFILEMYRGDTIRGIWFETFSTSQLIAIIILLCYSITFLKGKTAKMHNKNILKY